MSIARNPGIRLLAALALVLAGFCPVPAIADCPKTAPIAAFAAQPFYADKHGSVVDPAKLKALQQALRPTRTFIYEAAIRADRVLRDGDVEVGACAAAMMLQWAEANSLTAPSRTNEEAYVRIQMVFAFAAIELKLRAAKPSLASTPVERWIARMAHQSIRDFPKFHPASGNLQDWLAAMAAVAATATSDAQLMSYARHAFARGLSEVDPAGWLPEESQRRARALLYHAYALDALILAQRYINSCLSVRCSDERLVRLYRRVLAGLKDPGTFRERIGVPQEPVPPVLWIPLCEFDDPSRSHEVAERCRGLSSIDYNLGGDVHALLTEVNPGPSGH
jgi:poly(beta-D-mannuronate) lyase